MITNYMKVIYFISIHWEGICNAENILRPKVVWKCLLRESAENPLLLAVRLHELVPQLGHICTAT